MLIAVNKPRGLRSGEVVQIFKEYLNEKVGHSGTLDPMAEGLMILASGNDTKKLGYRLNQNKVYIAEIDFSIETDTRDMEYREKFEKYEIKTVNEGDKKAEVLLYKKNGEKITTPQISEIKEKLDKLIPFYNLPIPPFSAKKKKGKRLYELAREGKKIEEEKTMKIYKYKILDYTFPKLKVKFEVGSGTYIRSIAFWLGQQFNLGGTLTYLFRESIGDINLNDFKNFKILPAKIRDQEYEIKFNFFEF